jgi:Coenzyme PQQ synthesis protein D (PqqD)
MTYLEMPRRICRDLSVEQIGAETLVYDERRHKAFCLNITSSAIWRRCDGTQTVEQIAAAVTLELAAPITADLVLFALGELRRDGLLEADATVPATGLSRRDMVQKIGIRAALLLPVIAAIVAPKAAQAYGHVDG